MPPLKGFWRYIDFLNRRTYIEEVSFPGVTLHFNWYVDADGKIIGRVPHGGIAPVPSFSGGSVFIKGFGKVSKTLFHSVLKKDILKAACNMEFEPEFMKLLSDNELTFCISCWEKGSYIDLSNIYRLRKLV